MTEIAAEAGVTKPILYKHFGDKGGLYQAIAERYMAAVIDHVRAALSRESDRRTRLASTIDAYLAFVEREPEAYRFLMHRAVTERPEAQATVTEFITKVSQEVAVVLGEELRRVGVDSGGAEPWAYGIVGMVQLAGDWWLERGSMPRARLVAYLDALLWEGFAKITTDVETGVASA